MYSFISAVNWHVRLLKTAIFLELAKNIRIVSAYFSCKMHFCFIFIRRHVDKFYWCKHMRYVMNLVI